MLPPFSRLVKFIIGVAAAAAALILLSGFLFSGAIPATAADRTAVSEQTAVTEPAAPFSLTNAQTILPTHAASDLACRLCHDDSEAVITFPSGDTLPVMVDLDALDRSAHGQMAETPLNCTDCHFPLNDYQFPHPPVEAADLRSYEISRSANCEQCHQEPHLTSHPGPESDNPVVCTDCHTAHDVATAAAWQSDPNTAVCADCHAQENVDFVEDEALTAVIQDGLFQAEKEYSNDTCLACHSQPDQFMTFANGDRVSITIDRDAFHDSVHGQGNPWDQLQCTDCHTDYEFPHEPVTAASAREYSLEKYPACFDCHERKYEATLDDVHGTALAEGNLDAAVCTDCHGAHDTPPPDEPRQRISYTCRQCHSTIFDEYATSVHGEALLEESNPDVPTCIECHGVHNIADPTTALFRVRSPQLCASCHADEELMNQYDISTEVFDTYVADFHGTTVTLFEHQDPTVETNKAVCYDCHGVHAIKDPDDPEAGIKANLLETCQQCHPNATANFSDSWTSHYQPSLENNTLVFLVNLFYQIVIPGTIAFFGFLVVTDVYRRVRVRFQSGGEESH